MSIKTLFKSLFKSEDKKVKLQLTLLSNNQPADGVTPATVQALVQNVTDSTGVAVAGAVVKFTVTGGTVTPAQAITDANGQALVSVISPAPGPVNLIAALADGSQQQVTLSFVAVAQVAQSVNAASTPAPAVVPTALAVATALSPLNKAKADFENFVAFVEHGVQVLGAGAEAELVALKKKYL